MNRYMRSCLVLKPKGSQEISLQRGLFRLFNQSVPRPKPKGKRHLVKQKKGRRISGLAEGIKEFREAVSKMSAREQIATFGRILTEDAAVGAKVPYIWNK
jgi:hypothetical protein